jgi:hypothetical protein
MQSAISCSVSFRYGPIGTGAGTEGRFGSMNMKVGSADTVAM